MRAVSALEPDGRGGLTLGGARYLLIRPETLVGLQKAVEAALGDRAAACIVAGGRAGSARAAASLDGAAQERVTRLLRISGENRLGRVRARATHDDRAGGERESFALRGSVRASGDPVCHLTRGVLESLAASIFGGSRTVVETACVATGAPACRFVAS
jgi:hypothetical protein